MEAREHDLKVWPGFFDAVESGEKPFEWRVDDRDIQVGDTLLLREWSPTDDYTGRACRKRVTYALRGPAFGVPTTHVILGLADSHRSKHPDVGGEWVLVPREPTGAMITAGLEVYGTAVARTIWQAMLSASPPPPLNADRP